MEAVQTTNRSGTQQEQQASVVEEKEITIKDLKPKQRAFVSAYVENGWNASKAAESAGFASPHVQSARLLDNVSIKKVINQELTKRHLGAEQVLDRIAEMGQINASYFYNDDGTLNMARVREKGYLIKEIETRKYFERSEDGVEPVELTKIKLHDAQRAQEWIGKHLGLCQDRVQVTGKDGGPIETKNVSDEDLEKVVHRAARRVDLVLPIPPVKTLESANGGNGHSHGDAS